ncbi:MAG: ABC transporter ATP-binding protein [Pseudobdellovibrionaceae bacterium]
MIEVQGLTKDYGVHRAIHNLNFTVAKGDVVGFLGPNGAGKSTTMKIITGFMAPSSGIAKIAGFDVFENPIEVKKRIGYLPENPPVYGDMTVQDYLKYVAQLKKVSKNKIPAHVQMAIEKTNLQSVAKKLIQNLSKGFKQRVGIAQALVSDPEILILDEPTVGLDPKQVAEVRNLIQQLKGQHTIILSTHILSEVEATCQKVIIINKGEIVAQDLIQNLGQASKSQSKLFIKTLKPVADFKAALAGLTGVTSFTPGLSAFEWNLALDGGEDLISEVASRLIKSGHGLLELKPERMDLEDVFLKLTYERNEKSEHSVAANV